MASSWNLAAAQTSSAVEDVASSGTSLWQSVVDGAAEAMVSGKKSIIDVADDVYDYLPELEDVMDVLPEVSDKAPIQGDVPEGTEMTSLGKAITSSGQAADKALLKADKVIRAVASPVGKNFINDLLFGRINSKIGIVSGKDVLSEGGRKVARDLLIDNGILEKGKAAVEEEVYDKLDGGISLNQRGGSSASSIISALASGDPVNDVKLILGRYTGYIDENGDIIAEDTFNYNDFINPLDGITYTPEQYDTAIEEGKFTEAQVLFKIVADTLDEGLNYEKVRALGFVLGSKDYVDDTRDEGRSFKINLGPATE